MKDEKKKETPDVFQVNIVQMLTVTVRSFLDLVKKKDKSNSGNAFAEWYFWDRVASYAKNREQVCFNKMVADGHIKDPKEFEDAGEYDLGECPAFVSIVKVTEKAKTFDPQVLASLLFKDKKYKVPVGITVGYVDQAKVPKNPRRTVSIVER